MESTLRWKVFVAQFLASGGLEHTEFQRDGCPSGIKLNVDREPKVLGPQLLSKGQQCWPVVEQLLCAKTEPVTLGYVTDTLYLLY
jgi:hypothetical protein